jgi:hypothetical protein
MSALALALMHSAAIIVQSCLNFIDLGSWIPYFTGATAVQGEGDFRNYASASLFVANTILLCHLFG